MNEFSSLRNSKNVFIYHLPHASNLKMKLQSLEKYFTDSAQSAFIVDPFELSETLIKSQMTSSAKSRLALFNQSPQNTILIKTYIYTYLFI
jgi:hypothetical protein